MILTANPAGLARAGEAADTNPALLYYRAILSTPEISAELSDADRQLILGSVPELSEAADSTAKLVEAYSPSFRLLRQAASSKARCDWAAESWWTLKRSCLFTPGPKHSVMRRLFVPVTFSKQAGRTMPLRI